MPDHNTAHSEAAKVKWAALTALIFTQRMNEKLREITEKQGADRAVHAFVASVNSDLARTLFCREHVESMRRDAEELVQMAKTEDKETSRGICSSSSEAKRKRRTHGPGLRLCESLVWRSPRMVSTRKLWASGQRQPMAPKLMKFRCPWLKRTGSGSSGCSSKYYPQVR